MRTLNESDLGEGGKTVKVPVHIHSLKRSPIGYVEITFYENAYAMTLLKINRFVADMVRESSMIILYMDLKLEIAPAIMIFINNRVDTESLEILRKYPRYYITDKEGFIEVEENAAVKP